jgi:hypothetical protein
MCAATFAPEFYAKAIAKLGTLVPQDTIALNSSNRDLWWRLARDLVCDALTHTEQRALELKLPVRRAGVASSAVLSAMRDEKRRIQTKVKRAMQQIQRRFAALRRPTRLMKGSHRSSIWRHKRKAESAKLKLAARLDDKDKTMLPGEVIKGWLADTSKITKPLLEGKGV